MIYKSNSCLITWDLEFLWCGQMCHQKKSSGSEICDKLSQSQWIPWRQLILSRLHGSVLGILPILFLFIPMNPVKRKKNIKKEIRECRVTGRLSATIRDHSTDVMVLYVLKKNILFQSRSKRRTFEKSQLYCSDTV